MADLEIAARFALASQFALLALVLLRDHRKRMPARMAALLAIAGFADQVTAPFGPRAGAIGALFQAASISGALWLWLLAKSLFDDAFRWRHRYFVALIVLLTAALGAYFYTDAFSLVAAETWTSFDRYKISLVPQQLLILSLGLLALYEAFKDARSDLVETRRQFRRWFVTALALLLIIVSFTNYAKLGVSDNPVLDAWSNVLVLAIVIIGMSWLMRVRGVLLTQEAPFPSSVADAPDVALVDEIQRHMDQEQLFTEHGLTIRRLAEVLKEKEYRVRQAINGNLGFRNFNQFLNHYRVGEATRRLADPANRRLPVLTIAMDVGYASLAPFNKAFKTEHGMTPTEFRGAAARSRE